MFAPIRYVLNTLMWIPLAALGLSFIGILHPAGDSLAVFRPVFVISLAIFGALQIVFGAPYRGALTLALGVAGWLTMLPAGSTAPQGGQVVTVYQKNLLYMLDDTRALQADIRSSGADLVMLQELHPRNREILTALAGDYPHQHVCSYMETGALAVLSVWPTDGQVLPCDGPDGLAAMRVDTGRHKLWVGSVHLRWPWPYGGGAQARSIRDRLAVLDQSLILAGDFNMVPWAYAIRQLQRDAAIAPAGDAGATFTLPEVPIALALDHVFMPKGARNGQAETRPKLGSDHKGVVATFELP